MLTGALALSTEVTRAGGMVKHHCNSTIRDFCKMACLPTALLRSLQSLTLFARGRKDLPASRGADLLQVSYTMEDKEGLVILCYGRLQLLPSLHIAVVSQRCRFMEAAQGNHTSRRKSKPHPNLARAEQHREPRWDNAKGDEGGG